MEITKENSPDGMTVVKEHIRKIPNKKEAEEEVSETAQKKDGMNDTIREMYPGYDGLDSLTGYDKEKGLT